MEGPQQQPAGRRLAVSVAVVVALGAPGVARPESPPRPLTSAPSEYVEVVPSASGAASPAPGAAGAPTDVGQSSAPTSAAGAAADAVASSDGRSVLAFAALMVAVTAGLVGAARLRRRSPRPASEAPAQNGRHQVPNGW